MGNKTSNMTQDGRDVPRNQVSDILPAAVTPLTSEQVASAETGYIRRARNLPASTASKNSLEKVEDASQTSAMPTSSGERVLTVEGEPSPGTPPTSAKLEDSQGLSNQQDKTDLMELSTQETTLSLLQATLQKYYKKHCGYMNPGCWSDLDEDLFEMDKFFINLQTSEYDHRAAHANKQQAESIQLCKFLTKRTQDNSEAKCLLIEGSAGSGKSTLCDKLAWDWSWGRDEIEGLNRFSLLFVVRVCDFRLQETVVEYIQRVFCPWSVHKDLTLKAVESLIHQHTNQVLILLDGLDENSRDMPAMSTIVEGGLFDCSTVLVTARYGSARKLRKNFDLLLEICKLKADDIKTFINQFIGTGSAGEVLSQFTTRRLAELFTTPLLLTLSSIIFPKQIQEEVHMTQTALLDMLSSGLQDKIKAKYKLDPTVCDKAFHDMTKIAYDCLCKGNHIFNLNISLVQEKLGFARITTSTSLSDKTYTFTHKLLQEYLAANYIVTESNCRDVDGIIESVMRIPVVQNEDTRQTSMFLVSVCGLLARYKGDVMGFMSAVLPTVVYDRRDCPDGHVGHSGHLPLQCISEARDLMIDKPAITALSEKYPNKIKLSLSICDHSCLLGAHMLTICNTNKIDVYTHIGDRTLTDTTASLLRDIVLLAATNTLEICSDEQLGTLFSPGGVFGAITLKRLDLYRCTTSAVIQYKVPPPSHTLQISQCTGSDVVGLCQRLVSDELKRLIISRDITLSRDEWVELVYGMNGWMGEQLEIEDVTVKRNSSTLSKLNIRRLVVTKCSTQLCKDLMDMSAGCVKEIGLIDIYPHSVTRSLLMRPHNVYIDLLDIRDCKLPVCIDLLQAFRGRIAIVKLVNINTVDNGSVCSALTAAPNDLQIDEVRLIRCAAHLCVSIIETYRLCSRKVFLEELDLSCDDVASLVAVLDHCPYVYGIFLYKLGELHSTLMSELANTRKLHTLRQLGIDVYCMSDIQVAGQLLCAAEQLEVLLLYNRSTTAGDEQALCRMLCTAGRRLQGIYPCGVSPDSLLAELMKCSEDERKEIKWKVAVLCNLDEKLLGGDWNNTLGKLLPNYVNQS